MTNVINNPGNRPDSDGVMGMVVGILLILILIGLFVVYALPAMRGTSEPVAPQENGGINLEVTLPNENNTPTPEPETE